MLIGVCQVECIIKVIKMTLIYLVTGSTGEYDCRRDWNVAAFLTDRSAQALVDSLNQRAIESYIHQSNCTVKDMIKWNEKKLEGDPHMRLDYNGVSYALSSVAYYSV